jgi:thiamine pyrophosphokinase
MTETAADTKRYAILLDGPVVPTTRLARQLAGRRVIAADGGIRHLETLGLTVDLWTGDFDSSTRAHDVMHSKIARDIHPRDKHLSDGEIALGHALDDGADDIVFCGVSGGPRSDHVLFNLGLLFAPGAPDNCRIWAANGMEEHHPMVGPARQRFDFPDHATFSVFAFSYASSLMIENAKWPLIDTDLPFGSTRTLSNRAKEGLIISLSSGSVVVIGQMEHCLEQGVSH